MKKAYRTKSRKSTGDNRDVVIEDIGKGLMVLLTTLELYLSVLVMCLVGRVNITRLGKSCQETSRIQMQLSIVDSMKASWTFYLFTPPYVQLLMTQRFNLN